MEIIKLLLKSHILSGIGIASIFAVIVKIDKFISDDYFIQQFYTPIMKCPLSSPNNSII